MKFGLRKLSLKNSLSARFSLKIKVKNALHLKAPRGMGIFTHPKKALYNRVYNRTTFSGFSFLKGFGNKKRQLKNSSNNSNSKIFALCSLLLAIPASLVFIILHILICTHKICTPLVMRVAKTIRKFIFKNKDQVQDLT